jgi:hypothetical protein
MPDYKNGKIYKMWSPQGDEIYIGSTTQPLYARLHQHKIKSVCSSKILFEKYNDVRIELIELYSCDNKEQLTKKEGEYIRKLDCVNRFIPGRTNKEWRENNKEKIKEKNKEYYEDNKEHYKEYSKEYYENNKEKIKEYSKEYRENNKDKISKKIICECGRTFTNSNKSHHERTKFHQEAII